MLNLKLFLTYMYVYAIGLDNILRLDSRQKRKWVWMLGWYFGICSSRCNIISQWVIFKNNLWICELQCDMSGGIQ